MRTYDICAVIEDVIRVDSLVTFYYRSHPKDFTFYGEAHDFWELAYVDVGTADVIVDQQREHLATGELILIPPKAFHHMEVTGDAPANVFCVSFTLSSDLSLWSQPMKYAVDANTRALLQKLIKEGHSAFSDVVSYPLTKAEDAPIGAMQLMRCYLEELLIVMWRGDAQKKDVPLLDSIIKDYPPIVCEMVEYMRDHICDRMTVNALCEQVHYGPAYCSAVFKQYTGWTIIGYYNMLKMEHAKQLLRRERYSVGEIANILGFDTPQYFARVFRQYSGLSPRAFRQSLAANAGFISLVPVKKN